MGPRSSERHSRENRNFPHNPRKLEPTGRNAGTRLAIVQFSRRNSPNLLARERLAFPRSDAKCSTSDATINSLCIHLERLMRKRRLLRKKKMPLEKSQFPLLASIPSRHKAAFESAAFLLQLDGISLLPFNGI